MSSEAHTDDMEFGLDSIESMDMCVGMWGS